jgi:hypothetical protein
MSSALAKEPAFPVAGFGLWALGFGLGDQAEISTALAEMLTTELGAGEELRTVAGENVAEMKTNLALPDADSYGRETLAKIRENLNADEVVVGSFVPLGKDQIRLDLRLQDAVAGETLASVSAKGREDQIDDLVSRAPHAFMLSRRSCVTLGLAASSTLIWVIPHQTPSTDAKQFARLIFAILSGQQCTRSRLENHANRENLVGPNCDFEGVYILRRNCFLIPFDCIRGNDPAYR